MKNILFIILLNTILFAQDDRLDDLPFDDEPLQEESRNYFAIAGGYTFNVGFINVDEINGFFNSSLGGESTDDFKFDEISTPLIMHGGGGFTGIPFWKNIRVGFEAWAGSAETNELSTTEPIGFVQNAEIIKKGEFNIAMTALHADYGFVIADGLAVLGGLKLGWSGINIVYTDGPTSYQWDNINNVTDNRMLELDKSWLFVAPQVSIDWAATEFLMFSLAASYQLNFDNPFLQEADKNWKINRTASLDGVPDELNLNNLNIRFGIYLGLFNY